MIKVAIVEDDDIAAGKLSEYLERFRTEASESFPSKDIRTGFHFLTDIRDLSLYSWI